MSGILSSIDSSFDNNTFKLTLTPKSGLFSIVTSLLAGDFQAALEAVKFDTTSTDTTEREILITATDTGGDTSTAVQANIAVSSTANIAPVAEADFDTSDNIISSNPTTGNITLNTTTGNVLSNDNPGNTPTLITSASVEGESGSLVNLDTTLTQTTLVTSQGGSLLLAANGSYVYTPPTFGLFDPGITEVFNYTITDDDGETSTNTLTINANGGAPVINDSLTVDLDSDDDNTVDGAFSSKFALGGSGVAISDTDLVISDSEDPNLELTSIEVLLTNAQVGDLLAFDSLPATVTASVNDSIDGKVQLTLSATAISAPLADFQTALSEVTFDTTSTNTTEREISVTAIDVNGEQSVAAEANITIAQMVELSVDPVSLSGTEADATEFTITATAFGAVSGDQTIDLDLTGLDANDYTLSAPQITIADGETTGSVTLTIVDDNVAEGEEIGILSLINPSGGLSLGTTTTSNITITDDDSSPSLDLDANDDNTVDGKFQIQYTPGGIFGGFPVAVVDTDLAISDADNANLASIEVTLTNAQQGDELLVNSFLGSLPAGVTTNLDTSVAGEVKLTLAPETLDSLPIATFQTALSLVGFSTNSSNTSDRNIAITATDADGNTSTAETNVGITPTVELTVDPISLIGTEADATEFTITATASGAVSGAQTIGLDLTGLDPSDYTLSAPQITIADGETTDSVTLTIVDDDVAEGAEIGTLRLINPSGGISLGTTTTSNITITDDDSFPSLDLDADDDKTVNGKFQTQFTLGGVAAPIVDTDLAISDADNANLASIEVTLTNAQAGDVLRDR